MDTPLTKRDLIKTLQVLGVIKDEQEEEVLTDLDVRMMRLRNIVAAMGPDSVRALDEWISFQEKATCPGYMLNLVTGQEDETYITRPEATLSHVNALSDGSRKTMQLHRKPIRSRKRDQPSPRG